MIEATSATVRNRTSASCRSVDMVTLDLPRPAPASPPANDYAGARGHSRGRCDAWGSREPPGRLPVKRHAGMRSGSVEVHVEAVQGEDRLPGGHDRAVDRVLGVVA